MAEESVRNGLATVSIEEHRPEVVKSTKMMPQKEEEESSEEEEDTGEIVEVRRPKQGQDAPLEIDAKQLNSDVEEEDASVLPPPPKTATTTKNNNDIGNKPSVGIAKSSSVTFADEVEQPEEEEEEEEDCHSPLQIRQQKRHNQNETVSEPAASPRSTATTPIMMAPSSPTPTTPTSTGKPPAISKQLEAEEVESGDEGSYPQPPKETATRAQKMAAIAAGQSSTENGGNQFPSKTFTCRFCGLSYAYITTLKAHERVHDVEEPYRCGKCGTGFRFYSEYDYHLRSHKDQKQYKCKCSRSFNLYTDLINHRCELDALLNGPEEEELEPIHAPIGMTHRPPPPAVPLRSYPDSRRKHYICHYCGKSYAESRDLKYHIYSHRGERAFNVRSVVYQSCPDDSKIWKSDLDYFDYD